MMRIGTREIMWIPKMMIMAVSRDDLFLWQAEILSATGAVSHVQFSLSWNFYNADLGGDLVIILVVVLMMILMMMI